MRAVVALSLVAAARGVALRTRARVPNCTPNNLHAFLATPRNWPDIVLSSVGVEGAAADAPLKRDGVVDELFGLPPVLPLRVAWRCEATDPNRGLLDVRSADGLAGVAKDCRMLFDVSADGDDASVVELEMSYPLPRPHTWQEL